MVQIMTRIFPTVQKQQKWNIFDKLLSCHGGIWHMLYGRNLFLRSWYQLFFYGYFWFKTFQPCTKWLDTSIITHFEEMNQYHQSRKEYLAKSVATSSTSKRRSSSSAGNASEENDPTKIWPPIYLLDALLGTFLHLSSSFSTRDDGQGRIGVVGDTSLLCEPLPSIFTLIVQ